MIALLLLAAVELPLGPFARPGVPVLLDSDAAVEVDLAGWTWRIDGPTEVAAPQLPCTIALPDGTLRLRAPDDGRALVGRLHAGEGDGVPIRLVRGMGWQPLDVFDRVVAGACAPWERAILEAWEAAGGDVVFPGEAESAPRLLAVPRAGNVLPEIYDLAARRGIGSRSHEVARLLAAAMTGVIALLVLAGARGLLAARRVAALCLLIGVAGGAVGAWLTRRAAEPFTEARVVIHYPDRVREFRMFHAEWDGATMPAPDGVPFYYRGAGDPWWPDGGRILRADRGIIRGFVRDGPAAEPARTGNPEIRRILRPVLRSQVPEGAEARWWWGTDAFQGGAGPIRPIVEIEAVGVR